MDSIIDALVGDRDLLLRFFLFFSRFECALKRCGFLKQGEKAEANWDMYATSLMGRFADVDNPTFREAVEFLKREPPKTQIVAENKLGWRDTAQGCGECHECYILRLVRTVRNNLFHGGKYPDGPIDEVARNQRLLNAGITVLKQCLELSESVESIFFEEVV